MRSEADAEVKVEVDTEGRVEVKTEAQSEAKPEPDPEVKPETDDPEVGGGPVAGPSGTSGAVGTPVVVKIEDPEEEGKCH